MLRALRFLDGLMDAEAIAAFNAELSADAGRRETFVRVCELRGHLLEYRMAARAGGGGDDEDLVGPALVPPPWFEANVEVERPRRWRPILAVAAAVALPLVLAGTLYIAMRPPQSGGLASSSGGRARDAASTTSTTTVVVPPQAVEVIAPVEAKTEPAPAAVLMATAGARWGAAAHGDCRPGQALPGGVIDLEAGFAEVRLRSGATFIVEGPGRFEVRGDAMAVELGLGKLTATVPVEARGFAVRTASATVVDFGTEFGIEAAADRSTRVQVFRGEVEAKAARAPGAASGAEPGKRLVRDQAAEVSPEAVAVTPAKPPTTAPSDAARVFVRDLSAARMALPLRNTGAGDLAEGDDDTSWQYVAGPTGPLPQPTPAVVFPAVPGRYGDNRPMAKWISSEPGPSSLPDGAYTFRTHVDFSGFKAGTADVQARVRVDNYIKDILVNGKSTGVRVPSDRENSAIERKIKIPAAAFSPGKNRIDVVVINEPMTNNLPSPMALMVEWSATAAPEIER